MKQSTETNTEVGQRRALWIGLAISITIGLFAWLPRAQTSMAIQGSLLGIGAFGVLAVLLLRGRDVAIEWVVRRHHVVQAMMHSTIFIYWATEIDEVQNQFALIGVQVAIAYLLDLVLSWWRRGRWVVGFGPLPVVGSINLFLWFKDEWWFLQVLMLLIAFGSKPFLRWERDGRNTHIFNPSAVALAALSLGVLLAGKTDITWGQTIATSLNAPTYMFETIFAVGIIVQILFDTTLVTAGAALTTWIIGIIYFQVTGWWFFNDTHIPIAVFLGMNLLITDPTTSPKSKVGRFIFGMSYGIAVFPLWSGLQYLGRPTFYDKLLQVPILNLMVPLYERLGVWIEERAPHWPSLGKNWVHVIVWVALFLLLRPGLIDHPGKAVSHGHMFAHGVGGAEKDTRKAAALFEKSCYRGVPLGCFELAKLYLAGDGVPNDVDEARRLLRKACDGGEWGACTELGVLMFEAGDRAGGVALYEQACEESEPNACANLGLVYLKETTGTGDAKKAARYLERACELEHEGACRLAAEQTTPQRTEVLCRRGDADACTRLALDKQRDGAPASDVVPLLETACKGQSWSGCNVLGGLYARGIGVPQDLKRASELAELACQGGQGDACGNLAGMYLEGRGVDRNLSKAKALFQRACAAGVQRACTFRQQLGD